MNNASVPRLGVRQLCMAIAGLLSLAILAFPASLVMLHASPARAGGQAVAPDSIALTAHLDRYEYDLEDNRTVLIQATGTMRAYLIKDDHTALAGANLHFRLPAVGIEGQMAPQGPGEYAHTLKEPIRIRSPIPFLQTRGWHVRNLKIEVDGKDETHRVSLTESTASGANFLRKDRTGAGLAVFSEPRSYSIQAHTKLSFQVLDADGTPARNLTAEIELPQRNYRESIRTDQEGWVYIDRNDEMLLSIMGGEMVGIKGPIFLDPPTDDSTLFWWEDPNPRCEMSLKSQQERLSTQPGTTARFGFDVVNKGNQPDTYTFQVTGVPPEWVEIEYDSVLLFPFFGQTIYVNVTPKRVPETKVGTSALTFTVTSSCQQLHTNSDLKVTEFHQPDVQVYSSTATPGEKLPLALLKEAEAVRPSETISVIVRAGSDLPAGAHAEIAALGGTVTRDLSLIHGMAVQIPAGKIYDLAQLGWVSRVDQNQKVKALLDHSVPATGAPELWKLGYDGTGVIVAVVDTGVDYTHTALRDHVIKGPDFANGDDDPLDGHGHGTHVAGIIASRDPVRRGVAPGATIMAIKVLTDEGSGTLDSVIAGVEWAVKHGAKVINLSLGGPGGSGYDPLAQAVDNAVKSGVLVAVAAGNDGPEFTTIGSPGDARLALTVGATDNSRLLADWSSRGPTLDGRTKPDVVAPGMGIISSAPGDTWQEMSGTSMATPHVAGLGALLIQATGAEPLVIKEGLKRSAADLGLGPNKSGAGFVQPLAALEEIRRSLVMIQQQVYPGESAIYDFTLKNQANIDDRFRVTHWFDDNGLRYRAQPSLPSSAIRSGGNAKLPSGATATPKAQVNIPADWAGMEDAIYIFHLQATSLADAQATSEDRSTVKVKATKRSMAEYVKVEVQDLRDEMEIDDIEAWTRSELLAQTDGLAEQVRQAIRSITAGDESTANQLLLTAKDRAIALEKEIAAKRDRGQIAARDALSLRERLSLIEAHLTTAEQTALRPG